MSRTVMQSITKVRDKNAVELFRFFFRAVDKDTTSFDTGIHKGDIKS